MDRRTFAYLLIALIVLFLCGLAAFKVYYSRNRVHERRVLRTRAGHAQAMAKRDVEAREQDEHSS